MKNNTTFKQTEVGVIPSDWEVKALGEVGEVRMCRRVFNYETKEQGEIPFFKIGTFGKEPDAYISKKLYDNYCQRFSFPKKGDVLISAAGTIGRTLIYDGTPSYYQDSNIVWIENNETLIPNEFLYHVLQVVKYSTEGGTIQRLYNNILRNTKFNCPPTHAEQTAIAAALNDADALIQKLEQLIAKKRNIKTGAMQELLRPKEGWEVKKLGEVFSFLPTANNSRADLQEEGDVNYIHYGDIHTKWKGFIDCSKASIPFISGEKVKSIPFLEEGDLLLADASEDYEGIGECVEVKNIQSKKIVSGLHTLLLRGNSNLIAIGFRGFLKSFFGFQQQLVANANGVSVYGISKSSLKSFDLYLPNLKEQTRIARILSDMDEEIQKLETQLEKYKMLKQGMMQSLLTGKIRLV